MTFVNPASAIIFIIAARSMKVLTDSGRYLYAPVLSPLISVAVRGNEANLMLSDLTRRYSIAMIDSDALAAEHGVKHVPDLFHASSELVQEQRGEVHRVLRALRVSGF